MRLSDLAVGTIPSFSWLFSNRAIRPFLLFNHSRDIRRIEFEGQHSVADTMRCAVAERKDTYSFKEQTFYGLWKPVMDFYNAGL